MVALNAKRHFIQGGDILTRNKVTMFDTYGVLHLGNNEFLFDKEDLPLIQSRDWYRDKDGYLVSCYYYAGHRVFARFHRIVVGAKPNQLVDHINRNRADNRKSNLRYCDYSKNGINRFISTSNTSGITGVYYDKGRRKWVASITFNGRKMYLGRFSENDAVRARVSKERELFNEFSPQERQM